MKVAWITLALALALALALIGAAAPPPVPTSSASQVEGELRVVVPEGWMPDAHELRAGRLAFAMHPAGESPILRARIVQADRHRIVSTDVPGKVFLVRLSPDGKRVLIHQAFSGHGSRTRLSLLDDAGTVRRERDYPGTALARFGDLGRAVYVLTSDGPSTRLEIVDLAGAIVRSLPLGTAEPSWFAALEKEQLAVILEGERVRAVQLADGKTLWEEHVRARDLQPFGPGRFSLTIGQGPAFRFEVRDAFGKRLNAYPGEDDEPIVQGIFEGRDPEEVLVLDARKLGVRAHSLASGEWLWTGRVPSLDGCGRPSELAPGARVVLFRRTGAREVVVRSIERND